jgi:Cu/Zn superoxide dismutase
MFDDLGVAKHGRFLSHRVRLKNAMAFTVMLSLASAGCSSSGGFSGSRSKGSEETTAAPGPSPGLVASLRGLGSAVSGKVRVIDRREGITLLVSAINLPPGEYRVAFHANGNCSSPNGFSAGPLWAPAGLSPTTLMPSFMTNSRDGTAEASVYIAGVHTLGENGLAGRSVILYGGSTITPAEPGVPNNGFACGVFEPAQTLRF